MTKSLTYRTLKREDLGQMHRSFLEAFSDYQVDMKMSREAFDDRMLSKLNIDFDISPGVFSGDKLVGFIFQSAYDYESNPCAYNGGTGVIPGHKGQGLTSRMYDFVLPAMKQKGIHKCVLEVLVDNQAAIRAYSKSGFEQTKIFQCLMLKKESLRKTNKTLKGIREVQDFSIAEYVMLGECQAGMLDQLSQIKHHLTKETVLEYRIDGLLLAYVIFQPSNGRITQLAVRRDHRKNGIGSALVHQVQKLSDSKKLSILNIDKKEAGVINFFRQLGFTQDLQQYEMQKQL